MNVTKTLEHINFSTHATSAWKTSFSIRMLRIHDFQHACPKFLITTRCRHLCHEYKWDGMLAYLSSNISTKVPNSYQNLISSMRVLKTYEYTSDSARMPQTPMTKKQFQHMSQTQTKEYHVQHTCKNKAWTKTIMSITDVMKNYQKHKFQRSCPKKSMTRKQHFQHAWPKTETTIPACMSQKH